MGRGKDEGGGVSIKIKGSFLWKKYEILKVHFKSEDRVFKAPSRRPLSCWRKSLVSFDILKRWLSFGHPKKNCQFLELACSRYNILQVG